MYLKKTANYWMPALVLIVLAGLTLLNTQLSAQYKVSDDFAPRWMAARMWMREGTSPYSEEVFQATQNLLEEQGFTPESFSAGHFIDPSFYLLIYVPFSFVEYPLARALWMTLIEVAYLLAALLAIKISGLKLSSLETILFALLTLFFYPSFKLILTASILPPFILLALWACLLAIRGNTNGAGVLLFVCVGILPLTLPIAIFFMIWSGVRQNNSLAGVYFFGILFLIVSSLILFPGWVQEWFARFVGLYPDFSWVDTPLMRIAAIFPAASQPISIGLHVALLFYLLVEWYGLGSGDERTLRWKLMLTLNVLYFFNPLSQGAYLLLLLPGFFLIVKFLVEKWHKTGKIIGWALYLALVYTYSTRFFIAQNWQPRESSVVILLLPMLTFLGLQWFRWWAIASPKALIESS